MAHHRLYGIIAFSDYPSVSHLVIGGEDELRHSVSGVDRVIVKWEGHTPHEIEELASFDGPYPVGYFRDEVIRPSDPAVGNDWNPPEDPP